MNLYIETLLTYEKKGSFYSVHLSTLNVDGEFSILLFSNLFVYLVYLYLLYILFG